MAESTYREKKAREIIELARETIRQLPPACGQFIRSIEPTTTPLTRLGYARDLRLFFQFLQKEIPLFGQPPLYEWNDSILDKVTEDHIEQYMEYLSYYVNDDDEGITNDTPGKMRKLAALRSFYKYLFKSHRVSANTALLVDMPKRHEKPILRLEIDEMARMLDLAESGESLTEHQKKYHDRTKLRDLTILTVFLGTGVRVSELVGLNVEDIDFSTNGFLVTRKGGNQVILYLPDEVADQLKTYMEWRKTVEPLPGHESALFLSLQNKRISVRAVEIMVKKYGCMAAPLKKRLSPHKLRSTFGTNLYNETGDIYIVADVLGHSDVNTTRRHYAAIQDDRRRMAAKRVVLRGDESGEKP